MSKYRNYKHQPTIILNTRKCPNCGSYMLPRIKEDLSGKYWICENCFEKELKNNK